MKDWGGINRNSEMTILSYVNQADAERPATPFFGIASYSKILSIKDPEGYAVFDARVAVSLNAIQLLLDRDKRLVPPHLLVFFAPVGQNETINQFNSAAFPVALKRRGFSAVERKAIYGTYMASVHAISGIIHKSVLEIEMFLFAQAVQLSEEALPLARAIPPT